MLLLEVITVFLVAVTMGLALAHALEFPGKLRLDEEAYMTVQVIYYPGFTLGGIAEPLAILATLILAIAARTRAMTFALSLAALAALVAVHAIFWFVTQPANQFWLKNQRLGNRGAKFFNINQNADQEARQNAGQTGPAEVRKTGSANWKYFRDRWEYSHVARAVLSGIALIALVIAVAA